MSLHLESLIQARSPRKYTLGRLKLLNRKRVHIKEFRLFVLLTRRFSTKRCCTASDFSGNFRRYPSLEILISTNSQMLQLHCNRI